MKYCKSAVVLIVLMGCYIGVTAFAVDPDPCGPNSEDTSRCPKVSLLRDVDHDPDDTLSVERDYCLKVVLEDIADDVLMRAPCPAPMYHLHPPTSDEGEWTCHSSRSEKGERL